MPDLTVSSDVDVFMQSADQAAMKTNVGLGNVPNVDTTNAGNISSGTLPDGRFPATLPAVSGTNLTSLNASNLASGTVPDARFPATLPAVSGANLTNLNANNLASGTVPAARLPTPTTTTLGGVKRNTGSTGQFVSGISSTGDLEYDTPAGGGNVTGPVSSTDTAIARFNGTAGDTLKNSGVTLSDADVLSGVTQFNVDNLRLDGNTISSTDTNGNIALSPNGTGSVLSTHLQASGSAGLDLRNSGGTAIVSVGAGGGVNAAIAAPTNMGTNAADYHQVAGGTGTITDTAAGSSTDININLVPKGAGRLQAAGVNVPTVSSTDTLTNKTLTTPIISGAVSFPDDVRQTFNPGATNAGLNSGSHTSDPSSLSNGDLWYNSTSNELKARINGSSVALGAGGGGGGVLAYVKAGKGGTDQTGLGNGSFVEVTWPVEDADTGNNFASNILTVGSGQMWYLSAYITTLQATNANLVRLAVYKDGSYYQDLAAGASYASGAAYGGSCFLTAAGDYTIRAYSPGGQSLGAEGDAGLSWLEAQRFA